MRQRLRTKPGGRLLLIAGAVTASLALAACQARNPHRWTAAEQETLRGLWLTSLPALPPDPSNAYADDPRAAVLGQQLFFDTRFSANGAVACATLDSGAQKLISPAEMGELFKVFVLGRGIDVLLLGFAHGDRCHAL